MSQLTLNTLLVFSMNSKDILSFDPTPAISIWLTQKHRYIKKLSANEEQDCDSDIDRESCASGSD